MNERNPKQVKSRKKYSAQFKDQVVDRAEKEGVAQVAKDLGLPESMIYYWRSQKRQGGSSIESQKLQQAELARLKREIDRLEQENAFLKKVATYFTKESK